MHIGFVCVFEPVGSPLGISIKSQQALQMQREENKLATKLLGKQRREEEKQRRFDLRQETK